MSDTHTPGQAIVTQAPGDPIVTQAPGQLIGTDRRHGVTRYARQLAQAAGATVVLDGSQSARPGQRLHLHFTDRLWGASPEDAAERVCALATHHPLTVTLHDLPQASDGQVHARRAHCYRRVAEAARGVVCNSRHEQRLLTELHPTLTERAAEVIPLPIISAPTEGSSRPPARAEVAILGFVYPGKGHAEVIEAVGDLPVRDAAPLPAVVALGTPSRGHEHDIRSLHELADRRGVRLEVTGYLSDGELAERGRRAAVPVAAHRHVSASGSIGSWIGLGRRPLVVDSPYAREIDALRPGTIDRFPADRLTDRIALALGAPERTWQAPGDRPPPDLDDVAAAYLAWWGEAVAW